MHNKSDSKPSQDSKSSGTKPNDTKTSSSNKSTSLTKPAGSDNFVTTRTYASVTVPTYNLQDDANIVENTNPFAPLASPPSSPSQSVCEPEEVGHSTHVTSSVTFDDETCLGTAKHATLLNFEPDLYTHKCIVDREIDQHVSPYYFAFYHFVESPSTIILPDGSEIESSGFGTLICEIEERLLFLTDVLCVPCFRHTLYSVKHHRRRGGCSFTSTPVGSFLKFPLGSIPLKDNHFADIKFWTVPPRHLTYFYMEEPSDDESSNDDVDEILNLTLALMLSDTVEPDPNAVNETNSVSTQSVHTYTILAPLLPALILIQALHLLDLPVMSTVSVWKTSA